jgi:type III restriction enzyme
MKLHFESDLDYQRQAIEAVCDLFRGQEICRTEFTVTSSPKPGQLSLPNLESGLGVGNRLLLPDDQLLRNLRAVQLHNGLRPSSLLSSGDFTVEMETGTGKTYVYLRTIFELNRQYGFTKFVIVVPSVAIKEGVYHSLRVTEEHFRALYANAPFEYFLYDSSKLGQVRNFATSSQIQIMVVTVGAINKKDVNNLYKDSEKTGGEKPIDLIKATRPILIVDEPHSVDGGLEGRGKEALGAMNPLCTLRYSATHIDKHHMVYRLDAVDAYERKLVKQIEVASAKVEAGHNRPYVRLLSVRNQRNTITARVEVDVQHLYGVSRQEATVQDGEDLEYVTKRPIYRDCRVGEIRVAKGQEFLELRVPGDQRYLKPGEAYGDVEPLAVQREMIRRTIKEHLDKEMRLAPQGIKVLSLFFVDAVEKYRIYDAEGNPQKGVYAAIFEEEYRRAIKHPDYHDLFRSADTLSPAEAVHNGYFSIDKRKVGSRTVEVFKDTRGDSKADDDTYNLIMRDKERLLSFETPLKFLFSHSALREGWDNPNVFQICALREMSSEQQRRQTIGRGLRLCVNQQGERLRGFEVNTLTVIATESYEQFAENLQREIEKDTGVRFGIVEKHQFAAIPVLDSNGHSEALGVEQSDTLWAHLRAAGYVDGNGKVQEALRTALREATLPLPPSFEVHRSQVEEILRKVSGKLSIRDADERRTVGTRQAVLHSPEFQALWDRIKHKTTYRVEFDNEALIQRCVEALQSAPPISRTRLRWRKTDLAIGKAGVEATETAVSAAVVLDERDIELPDILTELQDKTQLTRRSICRILIESRRLDDFKRNPQQFIEIATEVINRSKRMALVDGIKYQRLGDGHYYAQELFEEKELSGYLKSMVAANKSVYEYVLFDSSTEQAFAEQLERNEAIRVYAKLPGWFKIPTPLGTYNPDWAVLVEQDGAERLYFVAETKGGLFAEDLRDAESAKIECGKAHFQALSVGEAPARYVVVRTVDDLLAHC